MPIASSAEIANLAGNKTIYDSTGTDITATVLADAVARGDSRVKLETGFDWTDVLNALYPSAQEAAECFGAAYILRRYGKNENEINKEAMDLYQYALDICASLASSSTESVYISSKAYKSFPINPQGTIHRSIPGGSDVTINGE